MDMEFSMELINYALQKNLENELWDIWKLKYPNMDKDSFISFADYKAQAMLPPATKLSYEQIETEMEKVIRSFEMKGVEKI